MQQILTIKQQEDAILNQIEKSFKTYALGDIRDAIDRKKSIAAFILASCFIDQMTAYRYNPKQGEGGKRYGEFVSNYLPKYDHLKMYEDLRCKLVHNYSIGKYLKIGIEHEILDNLNRVYSDLISIRQLERDLIVACDNFCIDIKNDPLARRNALKRHKKYPILVESKYDYTTYDTEEEADIIITTYTPLVVGQKINSTNEIHYLRKEKFADIFIVLAISKEGNFEKSVELTQVCLHLKLITPIDFLNQNNLNAANIHNGGHNEVK